MNTSKANKTSKVGQFLESRYLGMPQQIRIAIERATRRLVSIYGHDTCSLKQTAAHEAGHIIVIHCIGEKILNARLSLEVINDHKVWAGLTNIKFNGEGVNCTKDEFRGALVSLSGWAGEQFVGLAHGSSSIDERLITHIHAQNLDTKLGLEKGSAAKFILLVCNECININRLQFDVIRRHLEQNHVLTRAEAKRMLRNTISYNVNAKFQTMKDKRNA